jgi:chemotaxis protein MotB
MDSGIADARFERVAGHADRQPLMPEQPQAAANRRIAVTVLRASVEASVAPFESARVAPPAVRVLLR